MLNVVHTPIHYVFLYPSEFLERHQATEENSRNHHSRFFFATEHDRVKTENSQEGTDSSQEMKSLSILSYKLLMLWM